MKMDRITNSILLIFCAVPLIIMPWNVDYFYAPKIYVVLCIVLYITWVSKKPENLIWVFNPRQNYLLLIYMILIIISTMFSQNIIASINGVRQREEGLIAIIVYMLVYLYTKRYYQFKKQHLIWLMLSAGMVALYGIMQFYGFDPIPRDYIRVGWRGSAFSTIGNPNFLGTYIVLFLPIAIYSWLKLKKMLYFSVSCILFLCLLCTRTRSAWIGAFISVVLLVFYVYQYRIGFVRLIYLAFVFAIITVIFNLTSNSSLMSEINSTLTDAAAVIKQNSQAGKAGSYRFFIWGKVIELIKEYPLFGIGLENLGTVFSNRYMNETILVTGSSVVFDRAHNEYLHIAVSTGIPSLLFYLAFVGDVLKKGFSKVKSNYILIPVLCSVIGYLAQAFFNISVVSVAYIYWIFLGIVMNFAENSEKTEEINLPET